jgi:hypothetical protein
MWHKFLMLLNEALVALDLLNASDLICILGNLNWIVFCKYSTGEAGFPFLPNQQTHSTFYSQFFYLYLLHRC